MSIVDLAMVERLYQGIPLSSCGLRFDAPTCQRKWPQDTPRRDEKDKIGVQGQGFEQKCEAVLRTHNNRKSYLMVGPGGHHHYCSSTYLTIISHG